jgi:hypothetical protein
MTALLRSLAVLIVPLMIGLGGQASAVNVFQACSNGAGATDVCQNNATKGNPIIHIIATTINILSIIIGFAAVIVIIVSGFTFITSGSDPQAVARARSGIIFALVGVLIVAVSQGLVKFVIDKL